MSKLTLEIDGDDFNLLEELTLTINKVALIEEDIEIIRRMLEELLERVEK